MNQAIVALGSNIKPRYYIREAKLKLKKDFSLLRESRFVKTRPIGFRNQPDFINGAVLIETKLTLRQLTIKLKSIERTLDRITTALKSAPRTIDLDIIVFNKKIKDKDVYQRKFLQQAILDIDPDFKFNGLR